MLCFGMLSAQTYQIGDVYTAPDGSQGIVYYLHPDGSGGWVVALTDASASCAWGDFSDVPGLANQDPDQFQNMLYDTAGYANTQALRNYQDNNTSYAAGMVDFAHGWVLPSPAQLSMLYAKLPFIASAITEAGGTEMTTDQYWCSAEKDESNAWIIHYNQGTFHTSSKMSLHSVRAVRSFTYALTYLWSTGDTTAAIAAVPEQTTEYTVTVTSPSGCSETVSHTVTVVASTPMADTVYLCEDSVAVLTAREAASYQWSTGDSTRSVMITDAGFYLVTATPANGCSVVDTFKVTSVFVNGISDISIPAICAGDSAVITMGNDATCNVTFVTHETILALHDTVFLPDGKPCGQYGCSYRSPLTFAGYADTAKVNSVNDIRYLRMNMEHSWTGDIYINLTCPNGQKADVLKYGNEMDNGAPCKQEIPLSSRGWAPPSADNAICMTFFGLADDRWILDPNYACDMTHERNTPGIGWNYCWSNNTEEGYDYAPGDGLIYREDNVVEAYVPSMDDYWEVFDSSDVAAGTQFYHPDESFANLIGCPLNGSWYIEVIDGNTVDNGYIFGWELALAEDIQTVEYADVVRAEVEGPWVTATSDTSFVFSPPADLSHDTVVAYLFHCYSSFGCGYDTVVNITFYARQYTTIDTFACNSFVWRGGTYTTDTTLTDTLASLQGCDSLVIVHLHFTELPTATITGPHFFCADSSVTLTASAAQSYLWSNGATTQTVTVSEAGVYTVTVSYADDCIAESDGFQLFESENPILDAHLSDMIAGDTQTVVIGHAAGANLQYVLPQSTVTYTNVTFLPDGVPCGSLNCSYKAEMTFSDFPDSAVIQSAEDIRYIRLKMEHSAPIDLYINLTCPSGKKADILKKFGGNSTSLCLSAIDAAHIGWPSGNVHNVYYSQYPYVKAWMGEPNLTDVTTEEYVCDSSKNKPGTGWNYCWSNNTTEGYQYASGGGCLVDASNAILYYSGGIETLSHLSRIIIDSSDVAEGTQFYHPDVSFDSLVGCPMNGTWTVEVIDGITVDNGYIFETELAVSEQLYDSHFVSVEQTYFDSLWVSSVNDSVYIITPPDTLAHDTTVAYTFTLVDENGCVFDTVVYITIYAHKHTVLHDTICFGDTLDFNGQLLTETGVYYDTIHTVIGYDSTVTMHLEVRELLEVSTSLFFCDDTADTLVARTGMAYLWSTGDTTPSVVVSDVGVYTVTVTAAAECQVVDTFKVISVQVNGISPIVFPEMCAGGNYSVVVGHEAACSQTFVTHETTLTAHDTVFLPDGVFCEPYGCSYRAPLTFSGYPDTAHVNSADDIRYVRMNLEHSYASDLYMKLTCPNGQKADILRWGIYSPSLNADCSDSIPISSRGWKSGSNTGDDTRFGLPFHLAVSSNYLCDRNHFANVPGEGWNYCWSNNDQYSYANGAGSLIYRSVNAHVTTQHTKSFDSSNVADGTRFYHPDESFDSLVGCPLNGLWYIEVVDGMQGENGYLFEWELSLVEDFQTVPFTEEVQLEVEGPWVTANSDSTFLFSPPADLPHDTVVNYIFHCYNSFGCGYDTVVSVAFYARNAVTMNIVACDSLVWNGHVFTADTLFSDTLDNLHGCDSVVTVQLQVVHTSPVTISGPQFLCADDFVTLTVNVATEPLSYLWSNGSTASEITVDHAGTYSVTAFYASGCHTESADFHLLDAQNPFSEAHLSDMMAGDTQNLSLNILDSASVDFMLLQGPWVALLPDTTFVVNPPVTLENDTSVSYTFILIDTNICVFDTVINISVYAHKHIELYDTVNDSELPYEWNGMVFTQAGCQDTLLYTTHGADSLITMHLSVINHYDTAICEDQIPFYWHGQTFISTSSVTMSHSLDCAENIEVITVSVHPLFRDTTELTLCSNQLPYLWHNQEITTTGTYYDSLTSSFHCDSLYLLLLTVTDTTFTVLYDTVRQNNLPYSLNEEVYDTTGTYVQHKVNAAGCDSIITLHLTVYYNVRTTLDSTVCDSLLPLVWNGVPFGATGVDSVVYETVNGADSTVVMHLTVNGSTSETIVVGIVENDLPYMVNEVAYDSTGTYVQHLTNSAGCDSVLTIHLMVATNTVTYRYATICQNMLPAVWEDHEWTAAGVVVDTFDAASGADSIVVKTLTVGLPTASDLYDTISQNNLPYTLNDSSYFATGEYVQHRINVAGCDSAITLHLTVLLNVRTELDTTVCDSLLPILWNEIAFAEAGVDSMTYIAANGVDSTVVMTVAVNASSDSTLTINVIEGDLPYTVNGFDYDSTGIYVQHLDNALECDSTLTIALTVLYNVRTEIDSAVCDSLLPMVWNGVEFAGAGTDSVTVTAVSGVDSTVVMTLAVNYPTAGTFADTVLENDLPMYQLNGIAYDSAGTYTQHLTNVNGCDSVLTFQLTVLYNVTSEVDSTVCPNELPFTWNGKVFTGAGTQSAVLTAANGVDSIVVMTLSLLPSPNAHITGPEVFCTDNFAVLVADSAASYLWSTGDTTQTINAYAVGVYSVTVTNEYGCTDTASLPLNEAIMVNPIAYYHFPDFCAGNDYPITIGHQSTSTIVLESLVSALSWADTVFLPDGMPCTNGCSYQSPLTFTDFAPGATITSVNDILYVRLNLEHSFAGDLYINLKCPNAQKADILKFNGLANSTCSSQIPQSSINWQSGDNAGDETYFGMPYDPFGGWDVNPCDEDNPFNAPGAGWNYCWSNNTTEGYTYAPGAGSLVYRAVNEHDFRFDSSNVAAGTQFYHPDQSFANLIGCPLNGAWTIEVMDGWQQDNGYLFGWELALASHLVPVEYSDVMLVTVDGPWATTVSDTAFVFSPPADLPHDTVVAYTFHLQDQYGCGYDTTIYVNVYAQSHTDIDTLVCDSFVWAGTAYTQSQEISWSGFNVHGCDSTVHINLTVNHSFVAYDTLYLMQNQLPYYFAPSDTIFPVGSPAEFQFSYTFPAQNGCDSVIMEKVYVFMNYSFAFDTTVCADALPLQWHGHTFTGSGTVTDSLQSVHGSDSVLTFTVTVDVLNATIGNVTHINCYGESTGAATAAVTGGISPLTYQWTNSTGTSVSSTTQISNRPAGNYTFTVSDAHGCSVSATVTLNTLHGAMQPGTISGPQTLCFGDTLGTVNGTAATGDDCVYQWQVSSDGNTWSPASGTNNTQNYTLLTPATSDFYLRRAWISGSCGTLYSDTLAIAVWPVSSDTIYDELCEGQPYQQHGFDISGAETMGHDSLTFVEHYTSVNGCDSAVTLMLTIHKPQETNLNVEICEGDGYYGNGFAIPASETVGADSLMRVLNLQTTDGCDSIVRLEATIIDTALRIENLTADFCEDMQAELVVVTNMTDYVWSTGEQLPNITVMAPGAYMVTATQGGCSVSARYVIEPCIFELYLPNAITPGRGEGLNDYFCISEHAQGMINMFEISIFSRWGEMVFYSTDKGFRWNGEVKGKIYHQNVYNYIINYTDSAGRPYHVVGSITVL